MANECKCEEHDIHLKEQVINGVHVEMITTEIIKELTMIYNTSYITNEQVLSWAERTETQNAMLMSFQENREFAMIGHMKPPGNTSGMRNHEVLPKENVSTAWKERVCKKPSE